MAINRSQLQYSERGSAYIWIIILIVIIFGLFGFMLWQQLTKSDDSSTKTPSNSNSAKQDNSATTQSRTYTSTNTGYIKSFDYPVDWRVVDTHDTIKSFGYLASPPTLLVADKDNSVRLTFSTPQDASDTPIDDQALSVAGDNGKIASDFTSLDGLQARKIEHADGTVDVLVLLDGGYGLISFPQSIDNDTLNIFLSSWKWQ